MHRSSIVCFCVGVLLLVTCACMGGIAVQGALAFSSALPDVSFGSTLDEYDMAKVLGGQTGHCEIDESQFIDHAGFNGSLGCDKCVPNTSVGCPNQEFKWQYDDFTWYLACNDLSSPNTGDHCEGYDTWVWEQWRCAELGRYSPSFCNARYCVEGLGNCSQCEAAEWLSRWDVTIYFCEPLPPE